MKKFIRIMGLALVLTLLCTSIAFAAPRKLADIEGLPELPDVDAIPTMKTKVVGGTQTLTLSAPLGWLCAVRNWEWIPVTFAEDGVSGSVEIDPKLQIGYGKCGYAANWMFNGAVVDWDTNYGVWVNEGDDADEALAEAKADMELDSKTYQYHPNEWEWYDEENDEWYFGPVDKHKVTYLSPEYAVVQEFPQEGGTWYNVFRAWNEHTYCYDTYTQRNEFDGFTLAYDGETTDGVHVMYDNYGKLGIIMVPCGNTNFLGTEEEPTKTEVYFEFASAGNWWEIPAEEQTKYWVLRCIKQTYAADENGKEPATTVWYSYNGNYEKTTEE